MTPGQTWRLLRTGVGTGAWNMAVDEAILRHHTEGLVPPTLRFYGWQPATVTLGFFQRADRDLDMEACRRAGIDWVRRLTGGRAVLHDQEVTYSVVISQRDLPGSVLETYRVLSQGLLVGLRQLGLRVDWAPGSPTRHGATAVCFDAPSWYELVAHGKKLVGSAQTRKWGGLLQHGSVPVHADPTKLCDVLPLAPPVRRRLRRQVREKAACINDLLSKPTDCEEVEEALITGFAAALGIRLEPAELTPGERMLAAELQREKYSDPGWNGELTQTSPQRTEVSS
jgi:lipoate-protein ligase A